MARPTLQFTEQDRKRVKQMAGFGSPERDIALLLEISEKTLRKHFRRELDLGHVEGGTLARQSLFKMAISGRHPGATIFYLKTTGRSIERRETQAPVPVPPFLVQLSERPANKVVSINAVPEPAIEDRREERAA